MTNTLAYQSAELLTAVKSCITLGQGLLSVFQTFYSVFLSLSLTLGQNKPTDFVENDHFHPSLMFLYDSRAFGYEPAQLKILFQAKNNFYLKTLQLILADHRRVGTLKLVLVLKTFYRNIYFCPVISWSVCHFHTILIFVRRGKSIPVKAPCDTPL